jgi:starch synthase (maltosyl-transferring)
MKNLELLKDRLAKLKTKSIEYYVPALWIGKQNREETKVKVDPAEFFKEQIDRSLSLSNKKSNQSDDKSWLDNALVYNVFVRYLTAFDHNDDGKIEIETDNFRETGTFLKLIALLPYLHSLGVNTIHLLPITAIGKDGMKGNLGSPYAIRNHYGLDENLSEPILELDATTEFKAFVELCHHIGMKVIVEFVFRTASKDSDLALEHPEWFYWIKESIKDRLPDSDSEHRYGNPLFTDEELKEIKEKVELGDLKDLPEPHKIYKEMFTPTPKKVARVDDKIIGIYDNEKTARIPGAFADWPPDDTQPPWDDVTYLRLYDHSKYNYIAYNTVRMYEENLAKHHYRVEGLWDYISEILPYYIDNYDIDGVMVDMGHALPASLMESIIKKARAKKKNFVFWEENFSLNIKSAEQGYDACIGYMPFDQHISWKMKQILRMLENKDNPIRFFATPESHNTPRAASRPGSVDYCKQTWLINRFMDQIPFMLGGFELASAQPINTGLGFQKHELDMYPTETLPLFSTAALPWQTKAEFTDFIRKINSIRDSYTFEDILERTFLHIETPEDPIIAFLRKVKDTEKHILVVCNMQNEPRNDIRIYVPAIFSISTDMLQQKEITIEDHSILVNLAPWDSICAELS